jgi:hypothetical protein
VTYGGANFATGTAYDAILYFYGNTQHCAYTQDIASFLPQTTFEYCPNKLFDYFYAFGYPKMKLDSGITYLTETKDKNIRFCCKGII